MKKIYAILTALCILLTISACSAGSSDGETGIRPYQLSEDQKEILEILGISRDIQIISFTAPEDAQSLEVSAYRLTGGGEWDDIGGGKISKGGRDVPADALSGTLSIRFMEDFTIDFNISSAGVYSFQSEPVPNSASITASGGVALDSFQEIGVNSETPVVIMAYGNIASIPAYSLEDYYEPSKFDGMDIVLAVTMEFSDVS